MGNKAVKISKRKRKANLIEKCKAMVKRKKAKRKQSSELRKAMESSNMNLGENEGMSVNYLERKQDLSSNTNAELQNVLPTTIQTDNDSLPYHVERTSIVTVGSCTESRNELGVKKSKNGKGSPKGGGKAAKRSGLQKKEQVASEEDDATSSVGDLSGSETEYQDDINEEQLDKQNAVLRTERKIGNNSEKSQVRQKKRKAGKHRTLISRSEDKFDMFGRYIATLLRSLPPQRAVEVQPQIVSLVAAAGLSNSGVQYYDSQDIETLIIMTEAE